MFNTAKATAAKAHSNDLREYKNALQGIQVANDPFIFPLSSPKYTGAVLETILRSCSKEVVIFNSDFQSGFTEPKDFFNSDFLDKYLRDGGILRIITGINYDPSVQSRIKVLTKARPNLLLIQTEKFAVLFDRFREFLRANYYNQNALRKSEYSFAVGDQKQIKIIFGCYPNSLGYGSFNSPDSASLLLKFFEEIFNELQA